MFHFHNLLAWGFPGWRDILAVVCLLATLGCTGAPPPAPTGITAATPRPASVEPAALTPRLPAGGKKTPPPSLPDLTLQPDFTVTPSPATLPPALTPHLTATSTSTPSPGPRSPTLTPTPAPVAHVLIVSIDGLRPDVLLGAETPHLDGLWQPGAYTWRARTVVPSVTLVAHASMLSGVLPSVHGITWNSWRPERGTIQVPTLFSIAREAGLSTAMVVGKAKLAHLQAPGTIDVFEFAGYTDAAVIQVTGQIIAQARPVVLFVHLPDVDGAGHAWGWGSDMQLRTVSATDALVGRLLDALEVAGIRDRTLIIVTADHGGHGTSHGSDREEDVTIPWIVHGPGVRAGHAIRRPVWIGDTAATALYALGLEVPEGWEGRPVVEVFGDQGPGFSGQQPTLSRLLVAGR